MPLRSLCLSLALLLAARFGNAQPGHKPVHLPVQPPTDSAILFRAGDTVSSGLKFIRYGDGHAAGGRLDHWKRQGWWTFFRRDTAKDSQMEYDAGIGIEEKVFDTLGKLIVDYLVPDSDAVYPGGDYAWTQYVSKQIRNNIDALQDGSRIQQVEIGFVVEKDGTVDHVSLLESSGGLLDSLGIRMIKASPQWAPATIGGVPVIQYRRRKISFFVRSIP